MCVYIVWKNVLQVGNSVANAIQIMVDGEKQLAAPIITASCRSIVRPLVLSNILENAFVSLISHIEQRAFTRSDVWDSLSTAFEIPLIQEVSCCCSSSSCCCFFGISFGYSGVKRKKKL